MEYLYIIQEGDNQNYKIGRSYQVENRLKSLQTSNASKLILIDKYQCKDCKTLEKRVHNHLKDKKLNGEWFTLSIDELTDITETIIKLLNDIDTKININTCSICKFSTYKNENFQKHLVSEAHNYKKNLSVSTEQIQKKAYIVKNNEFNCEICNYSARDNFNYSKHLTTKKHIDKVQQHQNTSKINTSCIQVGSAINDHICQYCNKKYSTAGNLAKHQNKCSKKQELLNKISDLNKLLEQKDEIIKQKDETLINTIKQKDETITIMKLEIIHLKSLINNSGTIIKTSVSTI